jgi:hypothetical protein
MWKKQLKILNKLYHNYGKFKVSSRTPYGYWNYFTFPSRQAKSILKTDGITDRKIMKDEIVIESDLSMRKMNRGVIYRLEKKMLNNNFNYENWFSGNKSFHLQTHFPELMMIHNKYDLKLLKRLFIMWLYDFKEDLIGKHKIDLQLCGNMQIKLEHSWHHLTGERKRLHTENEGDLVNSLPELVWKKFSHLKNITRERSYIKVLDMNCMKYFFRNALPDCRKRVAFILLTNLIKEFGKEVSTTFIHEWNENINSNYIEFDELDYMIRYYDGNKAPGCNYIKDILFELGKRKVCGGCKNETKE